MTKTCSAYFIWTPPNVVRDILVLPLHTSFLFFDDDQTTREKSQTRCFISVFHDKRFFIGFCSQWFFFFCLFVDGECVSIKDNLMWRIFRSNSIEIRPFPFNVDQNERKKNCFLLRINEVDDEVSMTHCSWGEFELVENIVSSCISSGDKRCWVWSNEFSSGFVNVIWLDIDWRWFSFDCWSLTVVRVEDLFR